MPNGNAFINALTICEVEVEVANETYEMVKETVRLGYYKSHLNKALQEQVQVFFDSDNNLDQEDYKAMLYPVFLQLIGWWNVKCGEAMWPLTAEDIQPMDLPFISALLFGVLRHFRTGKTTEGEARGEDSAETKKLTPSSATSAQEVATTASPVASSPKSIATLSSRKARPASSPGNGHLHRSTTTNARASGQQRKSG